MAETAWGDDDFSQVFFFAVPRDQRKPIYIRVFDPETSLDHDELKSVADTWTRFAIYGGKGAITHPDARGADPVGKYDSGTLLQERTFGPDEKYNNKWFTFGPINPSEGELSPEYGGYVFKMIISGVSGNDGNIYKFFLSDTPVSNRAVQGGNGFTFEYCFRLPSEVALCHLYPFVAKGVVKVEQHNFDWDNDGLIRIVSPSKSGYLVATSGQDDWASSRHPVHPSDLNGYLDIQMEATSKVRNNNVVLRITNQYGELLPFVGIPIGGGPSYKPSIRIQKM